MNKTFRTLTIIAILVLSSALSSHATAVSWQKAGTYETPSNLRQIAFESNSGDSLDHGSYYILSEPDVTYKSKFNILNIVFYGLTDIPASKNDTLSVYLFDNPSSTIKTNKLTDEGSDTYTDNLIKEVITVQTTKNGKVISTTTTTKEISNKANPKSLKLGTTVVTTKQGNISKKTTTVSTAEHFLGDPLNFRTMYDATLLGTFTYPMKKIKNNNGSYDVVFSTSDPKLLSYIDDGNRYGILMDPKCHYAYNGIGVETNAPVPEPATLLLLGSGLLGLAGFRKKTK